MRTLVSEGTHPVPMRIVASSKTGQWLRINTYKEFPEPITGMAMYFCTLDNADRCYLEPYTISSDVEIKRATARRIGTTYVYDFLGMMEKALIQRWDAVSQRPLAKYERCLNFAVVFLGIGTITRYLTSQRRPASHGLGGDGIFEPPYSIDNGQTMGMITRLPIENDAPASTARTMNTRPRRYLPMYGLKLG